MAEKIAKKLIFCFVTLVCQDMGRFRFCPEGIYASKPIALFTRSVKNFLRQAYFCLFKLNFERKEF